MDIIVFFMRECVYKYERDSCAMQWVHQVIVETKEDSTVSYDSIKWEQFCELHAIGDSIQWKQHSPVTRLMMIETL